MFGKHVCLAVTRIFLQYFECFHMRLNSLDCSKGTSLIPHYFVDINLQCWYYWNYGTFWTVICWKQVSACLEQLYFLTHLTPFQWNEKRSVIITRIIYLRNMKFNSSTNSITMWKSSQKLQRNVFAYFHDLYIALKKQ